MNNMEDLLNRAKRLGVNVEKELTSLCAAKAANLAEAVRFSFEGGNHTNYCQIREPHVPHLIDTYNTVRYGELDHFCTGKEGEIDGCHLTIVIAHRGAGSPEYPGNASGSYVLRPLGGGER